MFSACASLYKYRKLCKPQHFTYVKKKNNFNTYLFLFSLNFLQDCANNAKIMNLFSTDLWCKHQKKFNNIHFSKPILFSLGLLFTLITAIKAFPPAVNANAYLPTFSRLSSSWPNAPTLKLFLFILKIISPSRKSPPPTVLLPHLPQLHHLTQQRFPSQASTRTRSSPLSP